MASTQGHGSNQAPEISRSRSSSLAAVSPIMRAGVDRIVTILSEVDDAMGGLGAPDTVHSSDVDELLQDVNKLQGKVEGLKLAQDAEIKGIREAVTNDLKKEITQMMEGEVGAVITESVAIQVREEMIEIGKKPGMSRLVDALKNAVEVNNALLDSGNIQLQNSRSRHANSTMDMHDDFNRPFRQIKHKDGHISKLFPVSFKDLFLYEDAQLVQLLQEYELRPLQKQSDNLNRFLIFIGVNVSVSDQVEEQPPAYPLNDAADITDERNERSTRRRSSASEKSMGSSWFSFS